tara:strand:+ start:181 stop:960 length:780 start_codon:yes stop_codon:yes gene_type:complete
MKLKKKVKTLDGISEALHAFYTGDDEEGYTLTIDVEDASLVPKAKVDEFRANNINLQKQLDEMGVSLAAFDGVDPTKVKKLMDDHIKLEEGKLISAGDIEKLLEQRTQTMRDDLGSQLTASHDARDKALEQLTSHKSELGRLKIDTAVHNAVSEVGTPRTGAMADILNRARQTWHIDDDGKLAAKDLFNDKGEKMSMTEWAKKLSTEATYLFDASQGGGANGGNKNKNKKNVKRVTADPTAIGQNLEAIATGEATVDRG